MIISFENDGAQHDLNIPTDVTGITYGAFLDWRSPIVTFVQGIVREQEAEKEQELPKELTPDNFKQLAQAHNAAVEKDMQAKGMQEHEYLLNSFKMFCTMLAMGGHIERPEMLEVLEKSLSVLVKGDMSLLPIHNDTDEIDDLLGNGVNWLDGEDITLVRLLCYLCNLFSSYIAVIPPVDVRYQTTYKGEVYYLEPDRLQRLAVMGAPVIGQVKGFTVDEVNELTEYQRIFDKKIETKGDPDGALEFQLSLLQIAIMLRKDGEVLPRTREARRQWLHDRSLHFKELPMCVVYEVKAFFLRTLNVLLTNLITSRISAKGQVSPNGRKEARNTGGRQDRTRRRFRNLSIQR